MRLIPADYLVIVSVILLLGARMTTNYLIEDRKDIVRELKIDEKIAAQNEANPIARKIFNLGQIAYILWYVWTPALLFSVYYLIRRHYKNDVYVVNFYALLFLSIGILNFLNDFSILMAHLI